MNTYNFDEMINRRGYENAKWDSVDEGVLPMFVADMDFRSSPQILEAINAKLHHGIFGYGYDPKLQRVLVEWFQREYGVTVHEEWLVLLPAIVPVLAAVSRLREGRVMINTPNYFVLLAAPIKAGKETILSPLKSTDEFYEMDFDDLRRRIQPDVRLFFLCNPHNPVGRVYTRAELEELSRFAQERNLIVVSDEAHCGLVFDRPHIPYFTVDDYAASNSITIMGPGKTYNVAGLPFGFAIIPNATLREEFQRVCYAMPHPGIFNMAAAKAAYGASDEWKRELIVYLKANRDYLEQRLHHSFPALRMTHVEGTYLQWLDFRPCGIEHPHQWFKERAKILFSDGKPFGIDGYVRMNFGTNRARLEEAIQRIETSMTYL